MNKKKSYKILGIFTTVIFIVMISCYIGAALIIKDANGSIKDIFKNFHGIYFNVNDEYTNPEFTYSDSSSGSLSSAINQPLDNVNSVNIKTFSPDVKVNTGNTNEITVKLITKSNDIKLDKVVSNNELTVYVKAKGSIAHFNIPDCKVEVTLPANYKKSFKVDGKSADISVTGISFSDLDLHSVSGKISTADTTAETSKLSTISGEIECSEATAKDLSLSTVSGDIKSSGKYTKLYSKSISGKIKLWLSKDIEDVTVNSTSGDIKIQTSGDFGAKLDLSTTSGEIQNNLAVKNITSSNRKFTADSSDGSDRIIKAHTISGEIKID